MKIKGLTEADKAVLELILEGLGNQAIADRLDRKISTIKLRVSTLFKKAGVNSRAQLMAYCLKKRKRAS